MKRPFHFAAAFALVASLLSLSPPASAQAWPARPIRIINPYQAGGGSDLLARLYAAKFQERFGQPVLVESKVGAGGNVGTEFVVRSPADGYTLLVTPSTLTINPFLFAKMPFDVQKDLAPVSVMATQELILAATNSFAPRTVAELIAYAKANPGKITYATPGIGTPNHLGAELLKSMSGIDMVHVPYKGQLPAITDVVSGQVQLAFITLQQGMPLIRADKLRGIALAAKRRIPSLKDMPVIGETLPGFELNTWYGMYAPAGTPENIVNLLAGEVHRIAALSETQERLQPIGFEVMSSTPAEMRALIASDLSKFGKVVKSAGIRPEQ